MKKTNFFYFFSATIFFLLFILFSPTLFLLGNAENVDKKQTSLFMPNYKIEYNDVNLVSNSCYFDGKIFSTFETKNYFEIFDINKDTLKTVETDETPLKVQYFYDNFLIFQTGETLNLFDTSKSSENISELKYMDHTVTAKNFEVSVSKNALGKTVKTNLLTISGAKLYSYTISDGIKGSKDLSDVSGASHIIAVDDKNVFFSKDGINLFICNIDGENAPTLFLNFIPTKMASNGEYLYYVDGNNLLKRTNIFTKATEEILVSSRFDIGNKGDISSMYFMKNDLLISSKLSNGRYAITDFEIQNNSLVYSGFAISKGSTAFNRISNSPIDIAKGGNVIAVLDENKITLIKNEQGKAKVYSNYLIGQEFVPKYISIKRSKLLCYNEVNYVVIDLQKESDEIVNLSTLPLKDIADIENDYFEAEWDNKVKTLKDLANVEFSLSNGKLNGKELNVPIDTENGIKSFAMDFESKEIYFILENEETILVSTDFDNKTISEVDLSGYKTTDKNANPIATFKIFNINEGATLYSIDIDNNTKKVTKYNGIVENFKPDFVMTFSPESPYDEFYVLSGFNSINREITVLVNKNDITEKENVVLEEQKYVYTSTPVDLYYLPLINTNRAFSLNDNGYIRLGKSQAFLVLGSLTVNEKEFYYGYATINGKDVSAYIPKNFTVLALSKEYIRQTFKYGTVNETKLTDEKGKEVLTLEKNQKVKIIDEGENKSFISCVVDGNEYFGYVSSSSLIKQTDNTLKTVFCLFAVALAGFLTSIYFVFIRKRD